MLLSALDDTGTQAFSYLVIEQRFLEEPILYTVLKKPILQF